MHSAPVLIIFRIKAGPRYGTAEDRRDGGTAVSLDLQFTSAILYCILLIWFGSSFGWIKLDFLIQAS